MKKRLATLRGTGGPFALQKEAFALSEERRIQPVPGSSRASLAPPFVSFSLFTFHFSLGRPITQSLNYLITSLRAFSIHCPRFPVHCAINHIGPKNTPKSMPKPMILGKMVFFSFSRFERDPSHFSPPPAVAGPIGQKRGRVLLEVHAQVCGCASLRTYGMLSSCPPTYIPKFPLRRELQKSKRNKFFREEQNTPPRR